MRRLRAGFCVSSHCSPKSFVVCNVFVQQALRPFSPESDFFAGFLVSQTSHVAPLVCVTTEDLLGVDAQRVILEWPTLA